MPLHVTALFEWIKVLRLWRVAFIILPLICSAVATSALFKHWAWVSGIAILCAGVIPAIFKSLDLDKDIAAMTRYANTFKSLQDRFRQARNISSLADFEEFKKEFASLRRKLDDTRMASVPIPEGTSRRRSARSGRAITSSRPMRRQGSNRSTKSPVTKGLLD